MKQNPIENPITYSSRSPKSAFNLIFDLVLPANIINLRGFGRTEFIYQ